MAQPTHSIGAIFAEDGYYLAKGIYPEDELSRLERDFDRIVDQLERSGEEINARWDGDHMDALDGGASTVIHTHNVHRYSSCWLQAYPSDRCDAFSTGRISLAGRIHNWPDRNQHVILSEVISREPIGPMVRQDDPRWRDIALWSFNAQIAAEELGINQANVDQMRTVSENAEVQRLLGVTGQLGGHLGLDDAWAYHIIRLVGNYADSWQRHFAPMGLERGLNATWQNGGLHAALPFN